MPSGAPKVTITERNLATNVQSGIGAVGAMVVASPRGSLEPVLQGSVDQFLNRVTHDGRVRTSYDLSVLEAVKFLEQSNKLYTIRPDNESHYGSLKALVKGTDMVAVEGFTDVEAFKGKTFGNEVERQVSALTFDSGQDFLTLAGTIGTSGSGGISVFSYLRDGDRVQVTVTSEGRLPSPLQPSTTYFVIKSDVTDKIFLANSLLEAEEKNSIDIKTSGLGTFTMNFVHPGGTAAVGVTQSTTSGQENNFVVAEDDANFYDSLRDGDPIRFSVVDTGSLGSNIVATTTYYVIKSGQQNLVFKIAATPSAATAGTPTALTPTQVGTTTSVAVTLQSIAATFTPDLSDDSATVSNEFWNSLSDGFTQVEIENIRGEYPSALDVSTNMAFDSWRDMWVFKSQIPGKILLHSAGTTAGRLNVTGGATGSYLVYPKDATSPIADVAVAFYGANPGAWNNDISITLHSHESFPNIVREPNAFLLRVFYRGVQREQFYVSRDPDSLSSNGRSMFVESVLQGSEYIRAFSNEALNGNIPMQEILNPTNLGGGDDGRMLNESDWVRAAQMFLDVDQYAIRYFSDSGNTTPGYQSALLEIAEKRDDAYVIVGTPYEEVAKSNYVKSIVDYKDVTLNRPSSYGGIYAPHVLVLDRDNNRELYISGTGEIAGRWARQWDLGRPWKPVANESGILNIRGLQRVFNGAELDTLFEAGVNPIKFSRSAGLRVWGELTLDPRPTPLSRAHARVVLNFIKPPLKSALDRYLFSLRVIEDNAGTRDDIQRLIDNFMLTVRNNHGIYNWRTVINSANNTPQDVQERVLNIILGVQIIETIEFINVDIGITPYGADFSLIDALI